MRKAKEKEKKKNKKRRKTSFFFQTKEKFECRIQTLFLPMGSFGVHRIRYHFGGDHNLLPPQLFLIFWQYVSCIPQWAPYQYIETEVYLVKSPNYFLAVEFRKCSKPNGRALRGVTQQQQKPTVQNRDTCPQRTTLDQYEKRGTGAGNRLLVKIERGF